ncbi:MAG: hypothetical protein AAFY08_04530 [Planctomycetota bacterium]
MSSIGTGIAAGLAQTAHQSQSVSRAADKRRAETIRQQAETNDRVEVQLRTGATADADAELPDHQAPGYERLYGQGEPGESHEPDTADVPEADGDLPRFDHVDVRA